MSWLIVRELCVPHLVILISKNKQDFELISQNNGLLSKSIAREHILLLAVLLVATSPIPKQSTYSKGENDD